MRQAFSKLKRIQPLINIRKIQVEYETSKLIAIRKEKQDAVQSLRKAQQKYIQGVEDLNKLRSSLDRLNLLNVEDGIDIFKSKWYESFKKVQEIENREKEQVAKLIHAEEDLKSVENFKDKLTNLFKKDLFKSEQITQDEHTIRRHTNRN